jgi:hypothetical protein
MKDYGTVKLLGPKVARKIERQIDGLVLAREQAMLDIEVVGIAHVMMIQEAILSFRAALMGVTLEWYKQSYCF